MPDLTENFDSDKLKQVWSDFAQQIANDMPRMSQVLKDQVPEILDNFKLRFIIANAAQEKFIRENLYNKLSEYLKRNLKNVKIELQLEIGESEKKEQVIYLSTDKFNYLMNLNPALARLKKNFNLELE